MAAVEAAMVPMNAFLPIDAAAADDDDFMDMDKAWVVGRVNDTKTTAATELKTLFFEIIVLCI